MSSLVLYLCVQHTEWDLISNLHLTKFTNCKMAGVTSGTTIAYPARGPEFIPVFTGVQVAQSLVFCVLSCKPFLYFSPFSFDHYIVPTHNGL